MSKAKQIIELMQPFVDEGRLLERSYESINNEIENFISIESDGEIIACAALKLYEKENMGEIYGLVVNKDFHNTDASSNLMDLLIQKALIIIYLLFLRFQSLEVGSFLDMTLLRVRSVPSL